MASVAVLCPRCQSSLNDITLGPGSFTRCPQCLSAFEMEIFPAFFRRQSQAAEAETVLIEGESTCFYHAEKRALLHCHGCGRFLCALCDCELHGDHFCPSCLEAGVTKGKIKSLENRRTKHDSIALTLALAPLILFYITIVTAPVALYVAIRHWNSPRSIVHRTKIRFVIAIAVALLEILGWILVVIFLIGVISGRANL